MEVLREWLARVLGTVRRGERGLESEVDLHLDLLTEDYRRRGLSESEARAAARRRFGGVIR